MITTSFNVPSHLHINIALSDMLLFDSAIRFADFILDASFILLLHRLAKPPLVFYPDFLLISLHVIC